MDTTSLPGTITWKKRFPDTAPHNVVWDKTRHVLWSASAHKMYAFSYNNDCHSPSLTAVDSFPLPPPMPMTSSPCMGPPTAFG